MTPHDPSANRPGWPRRLLSAAVLIGLPCVFWFGFFANPALVPDAPNARTPVGFVHYDIYRLYYPSLHSYFGMLADGNLPLWDPNRAVGFPAMGSYLFGILYPLNAAFLFCSVPLALTITCILHFALALWGFRRLLRGLGTSRGAATAAGVAYAFCGFMVFSLWHPSLFNAVATAPLLAAVGDRWARKGGVGRAALFGFWIGVQVLAGYIQGTVYLLYFLLPLLAVRAVVRAGGRGGLARLAGGGLAAGVVAACLAAVVVLPTRELSKLSIRPPGGLSLEDAHPIGPLHARVFLGGLLDPRSGFPAADDAGDAIAHYYFRGFCYAGLAALIFAFAAPLVTRGRRRHLTLLLLAAGVTAAVLALGSSTPLFRAFHAWVPTGDWFRFPRRFLAVAALAVAVVAGLCLDAMISRGPDRGASVRDERINLAIGAVALAAAVIGMAAWRFALDGILLTGSIAIAAVIGAALIARSRTARERTIAFTLVGALFVIDGFVRHRNHVLHPSADPAPDSKFEEARHFLRTKAGIDRVYLQRHGGRVRAHLPAKFGLLDGLHGCTDYEALTLERYARWTNVISRGTSELSLGFAGNRPLVLSEHMYLNSRLMDLMSVRYFGVEKDTLRAQELAALPAKTGSGRLLRPVFEGPVMAIFENPSHFARARFVPHFEVRPADAVIPRLVDPAHDPATTVILEAPPPAPWRECALGTGNPGQADRSDPRVVIEEYTPNAVTMLVDAPTRGFVVLSDQHYPGWEATVNGRAAPVLVGDYLFRAVPVEAGAQRIEFRFRPRSFRIGAAASGFGVLLTAFLCWWSRRRRLRRSC